MKMTEKQLLHIAHIANKVIVYIGAHGEIDSRNPLVLDLLVALSFSGINKQPLEIKK